MADYMESLRRKLGNCSLKIKHAEKTLGKKLIKKAINNLIVVDKDKKFKNTNIRLYKDTSHTVKNLSFYNVNRCDAYDLSPYDETILLDADYLILSNTLNQCWGHNNELMMNWKYQGALIQTQATSTVLQQMMMAHVLF